MVRHSKTSAKKGQPVRPPATRKRKRHAKSRSQLPWAKKTRTDTAVSDPTEAQEEDSRLATEILASIYYDINSVCLTRNEVKWEPDQDEEKVTSYRMQFRNSVRLLDRAVSHALGPAACETADPTKLLVRLELFIKELGWKMLAICALAEGFRRACRDIIRGATWDELISKIKENRVSLEVFARSRDLDWRGQLLKYAYLGVPDLAKELQPSRKMWDQHPHHVVQTLDNKVRRSRFQGRQQVHVDENVFKARHWKGYLPADPTYRRSNDGECKLCGSEDHCDCKLSFWPGGLVELVERPVTGVGVRALARFEKGDILGPFVGEVRPVDYRGDPVYALCHVSQMEPKRERATISPRRYGNWTRYIAHSCNASTDFGSRTIGDRTLMTIEARRDIAPFEDITVNYGEDYWSNKTCMCGEPKCISKKKEEAAAKTSTE